MAFYNSKNSGIIISGYVRQIIKHMAINDVIAIITSFYNDYIVFNVYSSSTEKDIKNCVYFSFVGDSRFYIKNDYALYVTGDNFFDQLGLKGDISFEKGIKGLVKHNHFNGKSIEFIKNVSMNGSHCFIYTTQHNLYGFGCNFTGQICYDTESWNKISVPELLRCNFDSILIQIACGLEHTLFLTENGNVYGCGYNKYGQLTAEYDELELFDNIYLNILNNKDIINIGCTEYSSFALNINGILYSFGDNEYGQLGIQNENIKCTDTISYVLKGRKIKTFGCGRRHLGILTSNNVLIIFGMIGFLINDTNHDGNKIILDNELIVDIKCGYSHNIIKTHKNNYYAFGANEFKQLLIKSNNRQNSKPTLISKKYISKLINCNNDIIDLIPIKNETFIIY